MRYQKAQSGSQKRKKQVTRNVLLECQARNISGPLDLSKRKKHASRMPKRYRRYVAVSEKKKRPKALSCQMQLQEEQTPTLQTRLI